MSPSPADSRRTPAVWIFLRFLLLGCYAFGGPMAHLAWFERLFVQRLKWLSEQQLAELIALCQALPGPASSQVAMAIGYVQGRWKGFWAAWIGFTLPSAIIMLGAAVGLPFLQEEIKDGLVAGMQVGVTAVIALALWRMAAKLLGDPSQWLATAIYALFFGLFRGPFVMLLVLVLVLLVALREENVCPGKAVFQNLIREKQGWLLVMLPAIFLVLEGIHLAQPTALTALPAAFYRTGLLVFGGGHVVLPLLEGLVVEPGWVSSEVFLFGYGTAQMVPGPLFSFSAFLGAGFPLEPAWQLPAGLLALFMIYLPSFLLLGLLLPGWHASQADPRWKTVLTRLHPAVVGLLLSIWIHPVVTGAIHNWVDGLVAVALTLVLGRFSRLTLPALAVTAALYVTCL